MTEYWLPLSGFPEYIISNEGGVRKDRTIRRVSPASRYINEDGDIVIRLRLPTQQVIEMLLSRLMAETFLDLPYRAQRPTILHLDGDKLNCRVENLEWRPGGIP